MAAACFALVVSVVGFGAFGGVASAGGLNPCVNYLPDAALYALCLGGPQIAANPGEVPQGGSVTITLTGWKPGGDVEVSVVSSVDGSTIIIGTVTIGPDGVGEIVWNVPIDYPIGPVTYIGHGMDMLDVESTREAPGAVIGAGQVTSSTSGGGGGDTGNLPVTGSDSSFLVGIGAALIVVGAAAVYGATRARREES